MTLLPTTFSKVMIMAQSQLKLGFVFGTMKEPTDHESEEYEALYVMVLSDNKFEGLCLIRLHCRLCTLMIQVSFEVI